MNKFILKETHYTEGRRLGSQVLSTIHIASGASAAFCNPKDEGLLHQELQKYFKSWVSLCVLPHFWQVHKESSRLATLEILKTRVSACSGYCGNFKKLDLGMGRSRVMGWGWWVRDCCNRTEGQHWDRAWDGPFLFTFTITSGLSSPPQLPCHCQQPLAPTWTSFFFFTKYHVHHLVISCYRGCHAP